MELPPQLPPAATPEEVLELWETVLRTPPGEFEDIVALQGNANSNQYNTLGVRTVEGTDQYIRITAITYPDNEEWRSMQRTFWNPIMKLESERDLEQYFAHLDHEDHIRRTSPRYIESFILEVLPFGYTAVCPELERHLGQPISRDFVLEIMRQFRHLGFVWVNV